MMTTTFSAIAIFCLGSIAYVFKYRGRERFAGFGEYVRKGWPIFAPFNCMLYAFTNSRAKAAILDETQFQDLKLLQDNWQTIREEASLLMQQGSLDKTGDESAKAFYDIGFRTFYKYGWRKFYLTWYGHEHASALKYCPKTVALLRQVKSVNGAMFSMLPPGGKLTRHLDPVACSLRYHLGLVTPNDDQCFINVDGQNYSWRDGKALVFDETYLHYAANDTQTNRLILMCDIKRPMNFPGNLINFFYSKLMSITVVPNMDGDKQGLVNKIFSTISPILRQTKQLKQTNRPLYLAIKYTVNTLLFVIILALIYAILSLFQMLF